MARGRGAWVLGGAARKSHAQTQARQHPEAGGFQESKVDQNAFFHWRKVLNTLTGLAEVPAS
jgi:hypothetical protein